MNDYEPGNILSVRFTPRENSAVADPNVVGQDTITLKIVESFTPFTMSATMQVDLVSTTGDRASLGGRTSFVLKLYDRRAARNMRDEIDGGKAYDPEQEANYQAYLTAPSRTPVDHSKRRPPPGKDELSRSALVEEWLGRFCHEMYINELAVYRNLMGAPRGVGSVPQLFGHVQLDSPIGVLSGILIELVSPAITLEAFIRSRGSCGLFDAQLASVFDMALTALGSCHDAQVINRDVRPGNVLVRLSSPWKGDNAYEDADSPQPLGCVIIDFGCARPRQATETDMEWARAKHWEEEDFRLATFMARVFGDARLHVCAVHHSACQPEYAEGASTSWPVEISLGSKVSVPFWSYEYHNRFEQVNTEEQQALIKMYLFWGTYEARPYPETLADLDPVKFPQYKPRRLAIRPTKGRSRWTPHDGPPGRATKGASVKISAPAN